MPHASPPVRRLTIGSLFSGYGGLDLAAEHCFDAETVWFSELNDPVAGVFSAHWLAAPNLGDISAIDWREVEPVDVKRPGFQCAVRRVPAPGRLNGRQTGRPRTGHALGIVVVHGRSDRGVATPVRGDRECAWVAVGSRGPTSDAKSNA